MLYRAKYEERLNDLIMQDYDSYSQYMKNKRDWLNLKPGDKIHLKSMWGMYEVVRRTKNKVQITCKKWINEFNRGDRKDLYKWVDNSDIRCRKGGFLI